MIGKTARRLVAVLVVGMILGFGTGRAADEKGGFGSARDKSAKPKADTPAEKTEEKASDKSTGAGDNRDDAKPNVGDPRLAQLRKKVEKIVEKRLGKKKDGFFVFHVYERKLVEIEVFGGGNGGPQAKGVKESQYELRETVDFHVLKGRDESLAFLVDYLMEYPPPDKKDRRAQVTNRVPPPQRDWRFYRWFPENEKGSEAAFAYREQLKGSYDEERHRAKELNTPVKQGRY